jgi:glycine cleavage system transcriptional repressor
MDAATRPRSPPRVRYTWRFRFPTRAGHGVLAQRASATPRRSEVVPVVQSYLVVSALGKDRPGLVEQLTQTVLDCRCRIKDSRMAVLGGEFATIMLVVGNWNAVAKLETVLRRLEETLDLSIQSRRTDARASAANLIPYGVEVVSVDNPRIVHDIANFFSRRDINIEDVYTSTYAAPHTGASMFSLHMTVGIPADMSIASLRGEFMDFCDELNLDAMLAPVK